MQQRNTTPTLSGELFVDSEGDLIAKSLNPKSGIATWRRVEGFTSFYSYKKAMTYLTEFKQQPSFIHPFGKIFFRG